MPCATSPPSSAAEPDPRSSAGASRNRFSPRFLQVNRFLNRPLASLVVRAVYRTRITPNQLTFGAFLIGLAGAWSFARGTPAFFIAGAVLTQLSSVIDCADGMLARIRNQSSEFGAYLDLILDRLSEFFLIAGCVYGYYAWSGRLRMLVLGLVALAMYFLQLAVFYLTEAHAGRGIKSQSAETRGLLLFLIFLFGVTNRLDLGFYVLFVVSTAMSLHHLYQFFRRGVRS